MNALAKWKKYEPILFGVLIIANLFPVLLNGVVLSLDGPAHVYNAQVLTSLLTGNAGMAGEFFELNPVPVPNLSGHFILAFFQLFFSPVWSEKMMVITILVLTPLAFRYFVQSFKNHHIVAAYFIFVLTHNAFQLLGFYNFLIALIPAFYLVGYLVRHMETAKKKQYIVMGFLLVLIYFSHAFVYLLCLVMVALMVLVHTISTSGFRSVFKKSLPYFLLVLPSVLLFVRFYFIKPELFPVYLGKSDVLKMFLQNRSLVSFTEEEVAYTKPCLAVFGLLLFIAFYQRIRLFIKERSLIPADVFFFLTGVLFILLFVLPDGDGWGGFYTLRTLLLINIFILMTVAIVPFSGWVKLVAALALLGFHTRLLFFYHNCIKDHQANLTGCLKAGALVEEGSLVLPVNLTGNWTYGHQSNRVGTVNKAIMLENYEANMNYFPVQWKKDGFPQPMLKNAPVPQDFISWPMRNTGKPIVIDYIFVMGDINPQTGESWEIMKQNMHDDYTEIFNEGICHLYKVKK